MSQTLLDNPPEPKSFTYVRPRMYAKQLAALFCPERYSIIEGSTKCGKTVGCMAWLLEQALQGKPGQNFCWGAPIYAQATIAYRRFKLGLPREIYTANESEHTLTLANKAVIWFKGADKPDSLFGDDASAAVCDEASRWKEASWHAMRSTLTATRGPVRIIGNVRGRKNWAYMLARKAEAGAPDMAYFKLTAYDAVAGGILDAAEIEDAKRNLPDRVFKELYLAEPSDDGGNPFGLSSIEKCAVEGLGDGPAIAYGADLAKSHDYTVVCGLNGAGRVCKLERWQSDWAQTRRRIKDLVGDVPTTIDSTGVGDPIVEDIHRELPFASGFKFTSTSKQQLMEGLAAAIQREEISFPIGWLKDELDVFEFIYSASGVRYSAPQGFHDDGVCALALAEHQFRAVSRRANFDTGFYSVTAQS